MPNRDSTFEEIHRLVAGAEPPDLPDFLVVPTGPRLEGTAVIPLSPRFSPASDGLLLPHDWDPLLQNLGVYLTADEYLEAPFKDIAPVEAKRAMLNYFLDERPRVELLINLAAANHISVTPKLNKEAREAFAGRLPPETRLRFEAALLQDSGGMGRIFLGRQPILHAMKLVLASDEPSPPRMELPALFCAVALSHAAGTVLGTGESEEDSGRHHPLALEFFRNAVFNAAEDTYALIDRTLRLWRDYGPKVVKYPFPVPAAELIEEACGLTIEDALALAFGAWAHASAWKPNTPFGLNIGFENTLPAGTVEAFIRTFARTFDDFVAAIAGAEGRQWDFLAFEKTPLLLHDEALFVLDENLLLQRLTNGLFWLVFDHLRDSDKHMPWTQTYGEMVEMMVEDSLQRMPPQVFGGGRTFFTEEDFEAAYGAAARKPDAALDFGSAFVLVDVFGGHLTIKSRIYGDPTQFESDTRKTVIEKAEQLDGAATLVLDRMEELTGFKRAEGVQVVPCIVAAGGYPVTKLAVNYIESVLREKNLLNVRDSRIARLCIVDLGEVELLEGLAEQGRSVADLLLDWTAGHYKDLPLRNYILGRFGSGNELRPTRMAEHMEAVFDDMIKRLGLPRAKDDAGHPEA